MKPVPFWLDLVSGEVQAWVSYAIQTAWPVIGLVVGAYAGYRLFRKLTG